MALTFSKIKSSVIGDVQLKIYDVTFDSAYPQGGEAVTPANFGLDTQIFTIIGNVLRDPNTDDTTYLVDYDATGETLIVSGGDFTPAAQGPFEEVSGFDTPITDLSAYTVRLTVIGQ